ncbi:putative uncharacterized protein [Waddlia chondrophila 2032/99]|uniref:HTH cro/C1-type domain-containing protein n=1 Tax=Waddlia chondrophila 2032/99 TaxID=765953 RepID=F8LBL7_9BACT|nr:putative uncharacterized protein [Waddlia chondrophila 2032/99]
MAENEVGNLIRNLRKAMALTQEQFAAKLGVTFPTVNRWENQKAAPSPLATEKLQKLQTQLEKKGLLKTSSLPSNEKKQ